MPESISMDCAPAWSMERVMWMSVSLVLRETVATLCAVAIAVFCRVLVRGEVVMCEKERRKGEKEKRLLVIFISSRLIMKMVASDSLLMLPPETFILELRRGGPTD